MKTLLTTAAIVAMMSTTAMARGVAPAPAVDPAAGLVVEQIADHFTRESFQALPGQARDAIRAHAFNEATDKSDSYLEAVAEGVIYDKASADKWESRYDSLH